MIAGGDNYSEDEAEDETACAAVPIANLGEQVADTERVFSFSAFKQEFADLKAVRYLPRNLPDYWLNQMLDVCYSGDDETYNDFQRIVAFIALSWAGVGT